MCEFLQVTFAFTMNSTFAHIHAVGGVSCFRRGSNQRPDVLLRRRTDIEEVFGPCELVCGVLIHQLLEAFVIGATFADPTGLNEIGDLGVVHVEVDVVRR